MSSSEDTDGQIYEKTFKTVQQNIPIQVSFTWTAQFNNAETVVAWFKIDTSPQPEDTDSSNNYTWDGFEVGTPHKPDLQVSAVYKPENFSAGEKVTLTITISNNGHASIGPSRLHIKHGDILISNMDIFPLKEYTVPGNSTAVTHYWTAKCNEIITIITDALNQYAELNEYNNTWSKIMKCSSKIKVTNNMLNLTSPSTEKH